MYLGVFVKMFVFYIMLLLIYIAKVLLQIGELMSATYGLSIQICNSAESAIQGISMFSCIWNIECPSFARTNSTCTCSPWFMFRSNRYLISLSHSIYNWPSYHSI